MGLIYRSSALTPSIVEQRVIDGLGLGSDIDLRTPSEISAAPDSVPDGAGYMNLNVMGTVAAPDLPPGVTTPKGMADAMENNERGFVTESNARKAFGSLITSIAGGNGAILYHSLHCRQGPYWLGQRCPAHASRCRPGRSGPGLLAE